MNAVPYTVERRPDTGVNNVQLGIWLFLASEAMLFGGLFSAYFMLRSGAAEPWLPLRDHLAQATINTLVLLLAGVMAGQARGASRPRNQLISSTILALIFCVLKLTEYSTFAAAGLGPAASTQMATYYLLTGVHVLHVIGGVLANLWIASTAAVPSPRVTNRIQALTLYWVFIDVVWLVILALVYGF